jgi:hypothetical protein
MARSTTRVLALRCLAAALVLLTLGAAAIACGSSTSSGGQTGADAGKPDATVEDASPSEAGTSTDSGGALDSARADGGAEAAAQDSGGATDGASSEAGPECDGGVCMKLGSACTTACDCCSGDCANGVCNVPACISDGQPCSSAASCCGGSCNGSTCTPLGTTCKTLGNTCAGSGECCSGLCQGGLCAASSFCVQGGDVCTTGADCCSGACNVAAGNTQGTCGPAPTAATCGLAEGMVCGGSSDAGAALFGDGGLPACGGDCCGGLCAPYSPTGVLVCMPPSGCHVVGDLCTKDGDCCGAAGLPGGSGTPVTCSITPPATVGVCRNPIGCKPDGDICKLATTSCNASCDCCSGNCENQDTCKEDSRGIPRCAGQACVAQGGSCASSANCCNGLPCVPNPNGTPPYVCFQGGACVSTGGACTVDGDCCDAESCVVATGSASGTCSPPLSGAGACGRYGQQCTKSSDCCGGIPCNGATGPCPGTGCTCHVLVH